MGDIFIDPVIAELRQLYRAALESNKPTSVITELLAIHAQAIHTAFTQHNRAVTFHLGSWCPGVVGLPREQIMAAELSLDQVNESVAREYGFSDWDAVQQNEKLTLDEQFESTVEFVLTGDVEKLDAQLTKHPQLVHQQSQYGHAARLLHYLGANGVESQRQITPMNCCVVAQCLIDHGSDVNATAHMYGGGSTALSLVLSSAHPANAGVTDALASVLKAAGAT